LKEDQLNGAWWSMEDLERRTGMKREWIKEKILLHPRFKKMLDSTFGGPVYYPEVKGEKWAFVSKPMATFLEQHFAEIYRG
jgi:phage pi2 protein 07